MIQMKTDLAVDARRASTMVNRGWMYHSRAFCHDLCQFFSQFVCTSVGPGPYPQWLPRIGHL